MDNSITLNTATQKAYELGKLDAMEEIPQWIPCSERLPEALQEVIVTSTSGHVYTSRIVHGEFEYGGNVVAWMPLPSPYQAERREE